MTPPRSSVPGRTGLVVLLVLLALVAVACTSVGISRERAIELARASTVAPGAVIRIETGPMDRFIPGQSMPTAPRDRVVWAVLLETKDPGECVLDADGVSRCPPVARSKLVILDFATGEFLYSELSVP